MQLKTDKERKECPEERKNSINPFYSDGNLCSEVVNE